MSLDVLTPSPLKLHVRSARTAADGQPTMYELVCRFTTDLRLPSLASARFLPSSSSSSSFASATASSSAVEWTLWKTFDDFADFDANMRARSSTFSRMMVPVAFAPEHKVRLFFHQHQTASFAEKRRKELDYYMQRILMLSDVGDFVGGLGSRVLANFLRAADHVEGCHSSIIRDDTAEGAPLPSSPCSSVSSVTSHQTLRHLHVDLRRAYAPYSPGEDEKEDEDQAPKTRRQFKLEIEQRLLEQRGEAELKLFKKRAHAFRKENDVVLAAADFVAFLQRQFDRELAAWLLARFHASLRNEDQRAALAMAGSLRQSKSKSSSSSSKTRMTTPDKGGAPLSTAPSSSAAAKKRTKKEVLARVEQIAGGNAEQVASFKRAARALSNDELSTAEFVRFLTQLFGERDAQRVLKMLVDVVPARRQPELLHALRRP